METIWTPLSLSLPDEQARTFPHRAIFLANEHGYVSPHDGRLNLDAALAFFRARLASPLGGMLLGEVFLSPVQEQGYRYRGVLCDEDAQLDELGAFLAQLREDESSLQLGVHLHASTCASLLSGADGALVKRLERLFTMIDWIECEAPFARGLAEHLSRWHASATGAPPTLCARVSVGYDVDEEEVSALQALLVEVASLMPSPLVHVRYAEDVVSVHTGGSERASARLCKVARRIVPRTLESAHEVRLLISGRIKHAEDARRVLDFHGASLVGMTRALLAEPAVLGNDRRGEMSIFCTGCMACVSSKKEPFQDVGLGGRRCILRPAPLLASAHPEVTRWIFLGASYTSLTYAESLARQGCEVHVYTLGDPPGGMMRLRGRTPGQAECAEVVLQRLDQCKVLERFHLHPDRLTLGALFSLVDAMSEGDAVVLGMLPGESVSEGSLSLIKMLCAGSSRVAYPGALDDDTLLCVEGSSLMAVEGALFLQMQGHRVCVVEDEGGVAHDTHEAWRAHYEVVLRSRKIARVTREEEIKEPFLRVDVRGALLPHAWEERLIERLGSARVLYRVEDRYEPFSRLAVMGATRQIQSSM